MENEQPVINPPASSAKTSSSTADQSVLAVQRTTVNYVVIAILFLVIGVILGMIGYERINGSQNEELIRRVVAQALAASRSDTQAIIADALANAGIDAPPDPNQRFTVSNEGPSIGPDDAVVTIVAFEDFRCGYCKRFNDQTLTQILATYPTQVRYVHRDFPILGQASIDSALAANCANEQGQFWAFHERFYGNQERLTEADFIAYAGELEMDVEAFSACYSSRQYEGEIRADLVEGQSLGIQGTPTFFINGRLVVGAQPYDVFAGFIEAEIAAAANPDADAAS